MCALAYALDGCVWGKRVGTRADRKAGKGIKVIGRSNPTYSRISARISLRWMPFEPGKCRSCYLPREPLLRLLQSKSGERFFTAKAVSRGLLRENCHITQWNIKSREFYGHKDLGSVYGYELLMPSEAL